METERLIVRRFQETDWRDVREIARSNARSEFAACDTQWPTDEEGVQQACGWFASQEAFWAVEVRQLKKVVCFVAFNGMDEEKALDVGHVMNLDYAGQGYEYEALRTLYEYAFETLRAGSIVARWALEDQVKLEPLKQLGMRVERVSEGQTFDGSDMVFSGCELRITREEWERGVGKA